nr:response regulator transcription factor [uncultured Aminipila sp.]
MDEKDILIIEDDRAIVRILQLELGHEGYSFDSAYNGKEGLDKYQSCQYGLVLLDLMLPEISGMEVCRKIRKVSDVPIIMLTAKRDMTDKVIGLDMGADDYITKPFEMEELLARIRAGLRRGQVRLTKSKLFKIADLSINLLTREVEKHGDPINLTKTEYDLLEYLISNKGLVLTRDQIIEHVWGYDFYGDTNILDVYIRYLRNKIDYPYDIRLIHTVRGVGYTLKE